MACLGCMDPPPARPARALPVRIRHCVNQGAPLAADPDEIEVTPMDCQEAQQLIVPWLEDELAPAEGELMGEHVERCPCCADLAGQLAAQSDDLAQLRPPPDPRLDQPAFWSQMDGTLSDAWETVQHERATEVARGNTVTGRVARQLAGLELRVSPVGLVAYAAALLLAVAWGWSNLSDAEVARAEAQALERELTDLERGSRVAIEPRQPPRVEAYRTVSHTPRRGTL